MSSQAEASKRPHASETLILTVTLTKSFDVMRSINVPNDKWDWCVIHNFRLEKELDYSVQDVNEKMEINDDLMEKLREYWPGLTTKADDKNSHFTDENEKEKHENYLQYQWRKHGSKQNIIKGKAAYFTKALQLYEKYNITDCLANITHYSAEIMVNNHEGEKLSEKLPDSQRFPHNDKMQRYENHKYEPIKANTLKEILMAQLEDHLPRMICRKVENKWLLYEIELYFKMFNSELQLTDGPEDWLKGDKGETLSPEVFME